MFTQIDRDLYILSCFINKLGNRGNSQDKIVERVQKKKKANYLKNTQHGSPL